MSSAGEEQVARFARVQHKEAGSLGTIDMEKINKATISAALIVLICFFMPWVQVSCGVARETETGLDLARRGAGGLWLIPLLMIAIILAAVRVLPLGDKL